MLLLDTPTLASLKIKNFDNYENTHSGESVEYVYAGKTPGSYLNDLKVCFIDDIADQTVGIATTNPANIGATIGFGVTTSLSSRLSWYWFHITV